MTLAVLAVSSSAILIRQASAPPLALAFYRLFLTVLLLGPYAWRQHPGALRAATWRDHVAMAASGLLLAAHFGTWIASLADTTVAASVVLVNAHPLFVALGEWLLFGQRLPLRAWLAALVAIVGTAIVGWGDYSLTGNALWGDALAFAGAVFFAGYLLIGRSVRQRLEVLPYTQAVYAWACLFLATAMLASGQRFGPYALREWLIFLGLAVLPTMLGHNLFNWALKHLPASVVALATLGEPLGSALLAWWLLAELPTARTMAGSTLVLVSVVWFSRLWGRNAGPARRTVQELVNQGR